MITGVVIYTDGSVYPNPGPGGWAAALYHGEREKFIHGRADRATNNAMELTAVIEALRALKAPCAVTLHSDSEYVVNGASKWLGGWQARDWRSAAGAPVKNRALWQMLAKELERHRVEWVWVRGHNGDARNELVDELAGKARQGLL